MPGAPLPVLVAALAVLSGCVAAPARVAVGTPASVQRAAAPGDLSGLYAAVVLTQNSRTAMGYVEEYARKRAGMASDAYAARLFTDLLDALSDRFGRIRVLGAGEAPPADADVVVTLDVYAAFANSIFGREKVDLTADVAARDGRALDRLESRVSKAAGAGSVANAVMQAVGALGSFVDASEPLAALAASARPRPAAAPEPPAVAAARPEPAAAPQGVSREELAQLLAQAMKGAQAPAAPREPALPPSPTPGFSAPERADDLAVVVGIESYSDIAAKAPYAERDADAFKAHLRALGVPERNIVLLKGSKAGRASLVKNVEQWLARMAKPESRVYFYFSGHGAPDVKTGQAYLVPWDGDPNFLESTAYPVRQLYEALGSLPAERVLVAMDSCFSGAGGRSVLASGARPLVTTLETAPAPAKLTVLAASAANEISGSLDDKGHGAFTYFLLQGLGAGKKTPKALTDYLTPLVQDEARRLNRDQTPQLQGDGAWPLR